MKNENVINEYGEIMEFIRELQNSALEHADSLLHEKKELEYKKLQQEFLLRDQEKNKIPNISMFSPLSSEEAEETEISNKDILNDILVQLEEVEKKWEEQKNICQSFEKLKTYFYEVNKRTCFYATQKYNSIDYSTKLLETQEMDRNRISRDLHDSTVQGLTSLGHKMEYCSRMVDKDPSCVKMELESMIEINKEIINNMRVIIYNLRPMSLDNIGFVSTIDAFCLHLRRSYEKDVLLKTYGEEIELTSIVSVTLYRIVQEACNNAVRHSMAKQIVVTIAFLKQNIEIDIEDNGIGFDIEKIEARAKEDVLHGVGLSTMRERTRLLSGSFAINTKPGEGTKVHISVPIIQSSNKEV